jgi:hypothetical protein
MRLFLLCSAMLLATNTLAADFTRSSRETCDYQGRTYSDGSEMRHFLF